MRKYKIIEFSLRHYILAVWLLAVWLFQLIDGAGEWYARKLYPTIGRFLSSITGNINYSVSDVWYLILVGILIFFPIIGIIFLKQKKLKVAFNIVEAALSLYAWFYTAWGLNYWQNNFYLRTGTKYVEYSSNTLGAYVSHYIYELNDAYVEVESISKEQVKQEVISSYEAIYKETGLNKPFVENPRVKTMLLSPLASMVGVTGSMGPFFGEFTMNGDVLPVDYPAIYAHELSHLYGITSEGEANFYAYLACIHSQVPEIHFSGMLSVFSHLLYNVRSLMGESSYAYLLSQVRPEIRQLVNYRQSYWRDRYSPLLGSMQDWLYDLYLRGHRVEGGRKNYSQVVALLIAWDHRKGSQEFPLSLNENADVASASDECGES